MHSSLDQILHFAVVIVFGVVLFIAVLRAFASGRIRIRGLGQVERQKSPIVFLGCAGALLIIAMLILGVAAFLIFRLLPLPHS